MVKGPSGWHGCDPDRWRYSRCASRKRCPKACVCVFGNDGKLEEKQAEADLQSTVLPPQHPSTSQLLALPAKEILCLLTNGGAAVAAVTVRGWRSASPHLQQPNFPSHDSGAPPPRPH